jgi:hypothetical protein
LYSNFSHSLKKFRELDNKLRDILRLREISRPGREVFKFEWTVECR